MIRRILVGGLALVLGASLAAGGDWTNFRGPSASARHDGPAVPVTWSETENLLWKTALPGLGTSSPITVGKRIFLTCYSGYGESVDDPGEMSNLKRHVVCLDRQNGEILWTKIIPAVVPESPYRAGNDSWHGYSSSTPASDGQRLYVFLGRTGVFCFDLEGNQLWQADVGNRTTGWGSATSVVLYKDLVIVNASVESASLIALNKEDGKQVWKVSGVGGSWSTPTLVEVPGGKTELVLSLPGRRNESGRIVGYDPETGEELWYCAGIPDGYVCPSVTAHEGIVYAIGGRKNTAVAVKAGGSGQVEPLWTSAYGSNVCSPVYHDGYLYWMHERNGIAFCLDAKTGKLEYQQRVEPRPGIVYASGIVAGGKLYYVSQHSGTYVLEAAPEFKQLAVNKFDHDARTNASPVPDGARLLIRSDKFLYCVGVR